MRIHTNERPHRCRLCGRSYSQSGNLNVHLKTIHGVLVDGGRARAEPEGLRPHKCYICNRLLTTSSNLYQHIRVRRSQYYLTSGRPAKYPLQAVHHIAIETAKSPKSLPPTLPLPRSVPESHSTSQLEKWTRVQMKELGTPTGSSGQNIPALPSASVRKTKNTDPTIQATLQQLSALASGSAADKPTRGSIYLMDQDKPISHSENEELSREIIKKESY